jgi:hypothetical protein
MSQFPHDQFAKNLLESLLSPFGLVQTAFTMSSEIREIDVYFTPDTLPLNLGLLSQCAATSAVFEPFRNPVSVFEIRSCMSKLYDLHGEIIRQAKKQKTKLTDSDLPTLWILTSTLAAPALAGFGASIDVDNWGAGVYLSHHHLKMGIIVIHQLPVKPETLWFRLLGKGNVQAQAISEVATLPEDSPYRRNALELFGNLRVTLEARQKINPEEQELIMQLSPLYLEKIQAAEQAAELRGASQGRQAGELALILKQLQKRFGSLSEETQAKITELPVERLEALAEELLDFTKVEELIGWLVGVSLP